MENELIQSLIIKGLITKEDVLKAKRGILTDDMKEILETLHLKFCELDHDNPTGNLPPCQWYTEDQLPDTWERRVHKRWIESFNTFLANANSTELVPETISEDPASSTDD